MTDLADLLSQFDKKLTNNFLAKHGDFVEEVEGNGSGKPRKPHRLKESVQFAMIAVPVDTGGFDIIWQLPLIGLSQLWSKSSWTCSIVLPGNGAIDLSKLLNHYRGRPQNHGDGSVL